MGLNAGKLDFLLNIINSIAAHNIVYPFSSAKYEPPEYLGFTSNK
jgi:hypothetical protein